ncbi:MAG: hypothetical protein M9930_20060 [Anaerolineae bacterium]|nr:hypothetical protein [Anaerolineae bacterium]
MNTQTTVTAMIQKAMTNEIEMAELFNHRDIDEITAEFDAMMEEVNAAFDALKAEQAAFHAHLDDMADWQSAVSMGFSFS